MPLTISQYRKLRRVYLNLTYYARHGKTRYNGASFGPADKSTIKPTQRQMLALRAAIKPTASPSAHN